MDKQLVEYKNGETSLLNCRWRSWGQIKTFIPADHGGGKFEK